MDKKEIIKQRIRAICCQLNEKKLNCLIVTKPANVTYTTGFSGHDSWAIITTRFVYLLTDSRYTEQAQNQCPCCRIIERKGLMAEAVSELIRKLKSIKTIGLENSTSLRNFNSLKKNITGTIKSVGDIVECVRSCKDKSEISAIRTASRIAAQAFRKTIEYIEPGISENELAGRLNLEIRIAGAINSFDTIVAFGANASQPHYQPGARKLRKNDTILIDFGVKYENYCCDLTRCFVVGKCTYLYKQVYETVRQAQAAAIKMVKAGVEIEKVDAAAREVISNSHQPVYGHGTGHGLGLEVHEEPIVSKNVKGRLKAGQIITIEPAVYIPGKLGIRLEDDILVTQRGHRILSR